MKDNFTLTIRKEENGEMYITNNFNDTIVMYTAIWDGENLGGALKEYCHNHLEDVPSCIRNAASYLEESGHHGGKPYSQLVREAESWYYAFEDFDMKMIAALAYVYGENKGYKDVDLCFVELAKNYIFGGPRDE